jgi:ribosomal protein S18 acetylase RimI-like enzyme
VYIDTPDTDAADAITDLWVDLAREQRQHDSRLLPAANRSEIRGRILQAIVTDGMRLARAEAADVEESDLESDAILGFVMFSLEQGMFERSMTRGIVQNLYVRPGYRGAGIGGELLSLAESELADRGAEAVKLEVMAANEAARRFYERHGYGHHRVTLEKTVESDTHKTE